MALIERKAEGQEIVAEEEPEETTPVVDLMAALEASLKAAKTRREEEAGQEADEKKARPARKRATG